MALNWNQFLSGPQGPSSPGYLQGSANTIKVGPPSNPAAYTYNLPGSVLGASTYRAPTGGGGGPVPAPANNTASLGNDLTSSANQQNNALLSQLNTQYDYNAAQLNNQLGTLGSQRQNSLNSLDNQLSGVQKQVDTSKTNATTNRDTQTADARQTAQDVQLKNRNTLRALGILNSSAAGDLLSKPLNEYDKQRAQIYQATTQRLNELDDFMNQQVKAHSDAVANIESQYQNLVGQIQTDLRFNDRQRSDAINAANAALTQRLADIKQSLFNYQAQVDAQKQSAAQGLSQLANYTNPTANLSGIAAQTVNTAPTQQSSDATIYQGQDQQKKKEIGGFNFLY